MTVLAWLSREKNLFSLFSRRRRLTINHSIKRHCILTRNLRGSRMYRKLSALTLPAPHSETPNSYKHFLKCLLPRLSWNPQTHQDIQISTLKTVQGKVCWDTALFSGSSPFLWPLPRLAVPCYSFGEKSFLIPKLYLPWCSSSYCLLLGRKDSPPSHDTLFSGSCRDW